MNIDDDGHLGGIDAELGHLGGGGLWIIAKMGSIEIEVQTILALIFPASILGADVTKVKGTLDIVLISRAVQQLRRLESIVASCRLRIRYTAERLDAARKLGALRYDLAKICPLVELQGDGRLSYN